jgi:osmotically inducible lipoprotein OsmB
MKKVLSSCMVLAVVIVLVTGCTNREEGTGVGAVAGGIAGNVLTGGSAAGTVVGAVGGGLVGNAVSR